MAFRADGSRFVAARSTHAATLNAGALSIDPIDNRSGSPVVGAPATVETKSIARGTTFANISLDGARIDEGRVELDRGVALEHFENTDDGIEQSWEFLDPPVGEGDIEVAVALTGHAYVGATASGLHFATPGKLGFRYGTASWVDADGEITTLVPQWNGREIVIRVPEYLVNESRYPAVLDPTIGAEAAVDSPVIGSTGVGSLRPAIASSGSGFLAVWSDSRDGVGRNIFGTRLSATGAVLDQNGLEMSTAAQTEDNAVVAYINGGYVVAWDNDAASIGASRVSTSGVVTSLPSVGSGTLPAIAARGTQGLLVYTTGSEIRGAVYSGTSFGASFSIASGTSLTRPAVAANPNGDYLVTWSEGATAPDVRGQFVTSAGGLSGSAITIANGAGGQDDTTVAFNGTDFVVLWTNNNNGIDIYGTRVTTAGAVLDTHTESTVTFGGKAIVTATNTQNQASIACGTGSCVATWSDRRTFSTNANDIYALRLDSTLTAVGAEIAVAALGDEQRASAITYDGANYRAVWHDRRHGGADTTFSAAINADGSLPNGNGSSIVTGWNRQVSPAGASNATNWLVAWSDSRSLGNDIMGVRWSPSTGKLDATAKTITASSGQQGNTAASFDGTNWVVVWNDTRNGAFYDIYGARVDANGNVVGETAIDTSQGDQQRPAIASGGGVSLVVYQTPGTGTEVAGTLINTSGAVVGTVSVCAQSGSQVDPAVAWDSTNNVFVVAWSDNSAATYDIRAARVSAAGAVLDANCGVVVSNAAGDQTTPAIAFGGGTSFISWKDTRNGIDGDIYGARVTASGSLAVVDASGIAVANGGATQGEPSVAYIAPNLFTNTYTQNGDIYGSDVTGAGTPGTQYLISADVGSEANSKITASASGKQALVAYEVERTDLRTRRVAARKLTYNTNVGSTCSSNSQCASGFCVDSRCCESACGGTDKSDCQACSVNAGSTADGVCGVLPTTYTCRGYADTFCDLKEFCDGTARSCPADIGRRQGIACTTTSNTAGVCPANDATGSPHVCQ